MAAPLWITYAWADNDEGDFDYLVQEMGKSGVAAEYDKVALVPGRRLWDQIARKIGEEPLSGWAYLITPSSLSSNACKEELAYALQRSLETKGEEFPLIGLLHKVSISAVPLPLRVRLCVHLGSPDWIEEVKAAVAGSPPSRRIEDQSQYVVKIHNAYLGVPNNSAVEIRPRFGELNYWRIGFPVAGPHPVAWGSGPANGGGISGIKYEAMVGIKGIKVDSVEMEFVAAGNTLSPSTSAYVVFTGGLPDSLFFGVSKEPFSLEMRGEWVLGSY